MAAPKRKMVVPEDFVRITKAGHRLVIIEAIYDIRDREVNDRIDAALEELRCCGRAEITEDCITGLYDDNLVGAILAKRARRVE